MATFSVGPPQPPSPRRLWPGQAGQSLTSPSCLPSPSPEGPQSMVNFSGDFLGEILALPSKCFGTPQKIRKNPCNICTNNSCKQSVQKSAQKSRAKNRAKNLCRKSVQKIRAKNPCRKSVQKIRAENPCRKSVQKICAKQTRANGFPKVTLQIEKPKFYSNICSCCSSASCLGQKFLAYGTNLHLVDMLVPGALSTRQVFSRDSTLKSFPDLVVVPAMADAEEVVFNTGLLRDSLKCALCLSLLSRPMQTPCQHRFCEDCVQLMWPANGLCPTCRARAPRRSLRRDHLVQSLLTDQAVRCPNHHMGCHWTGPADRRPTHAQDCLARHVAELQTM